MATMKTILEFINPLKLSTLINNLDIDALKTLVATIKNTRSEREGKEYSRYSKAITELNGIIRELERKKALLFLIESNKTCRNY
jgi:hypothetical protein